MSIPDTPATFVLVGHCGPDNAMMRMAIQRALPGAEIVLAASDEAYAAQRRTGRVLLINRILDGDFARVEGMKLLEEIAAMPDEQRPVAVLISDLADWQSQAEALGAPKGFGKSRVNAAESAERLRAYAQQARTDGAAE